MFGPSSKILISSQRSMTKSLSLSELSVQERRADSALVLLFSTAAVIGGSASAVPQRSTRVPLLAVKAVQVGCFWPAPLPDSSDTALHAISAIIEHCSASLTWEALDPRGSNGRDCGEVEQAVKTAAKRI